MKIDQVEWIRYCVPTGNEGGSAGHCALRIRTDGGAWGWSELRHSSWDWFDCAADVAEALRGRDPSDIDGIFDDLYPRFPLHAATLVDIALWDLAGRAEGRPVHALLGTVRDRIPAYRSTPFNVGGPADYAEFALQAKERGFRGCKIHPTHNGFWDERTGGDVDMDLAIYGAVRQAVGPDWHLMTDPYHTYDYEQALRVGRILDELNFLWYESPMHEGMDWVDRYAKLCRAIETPVCAPECQEGAADVRREWIERGATDMGRTDIYYGGLTGCLRLVRACEQAGIQLDLHLGNAYQLQVVGATSPDVYPLYEQYWWYENPAIVEGPNPPEIDDEGYAHVPQGVGMGLEPDWDYIESNLMD
jgi:L-alanine-DL-glutamate epimerase-like enolase superfamily enzyme